MEKLITIKVTVKDDNSLVESVDREIRGFLRDHLEFAVRDTLNSSIVNHTYEGMFTRVQILHL